MKQVFAALISLFLLSSVCQAQDKLDLKSPKAKESYSLGFSFGEGLKKQEMDIDLEIYAAGIRDSLEGKNPQISEEEIRAAIEGIRQRAYAAQQQRLREQAGKNLEEGKAFLAENAKKEGVKTLPSGLQYRVITEGTGASPKAGETVTVNYRGTFLDGTEFDSSYKRGKPASFQVDGVIAGWTEALQMMKPGDKWQLFVPSELAYGQRGMGRIPPNSTLIFEVELVSLGSAE